MTLAGMITYLKFEVTSEARTSQGKGTERLYKRLSSTAKREEEFCDGIDMLVSVRGGAPGVDVGEVFDEDLSV